jgi:hypothetical protein
MTIKATRDPLGHVALTFIVRQSYKPDAWSVRAMVKMEAGQDVPARVGRRASDPGRLVALVARTGRPSACNAVHMAVPPSGCHRRGTVVGALTACCSAQATPSAGATRLIDAVRHGLDR